MIQAHLGSGLSHCSQEVLSQSKGALTFARLQAESQAIWYDGSKKAKAFIKGGLRVQRAAVCSSPNINVRFLTLDFKGDWGREPGKMQHA